MARIIKTRAHSRRGKPRYHRNPRQARLPAQRWNAICAVAHDRPRSSSDTRKRDCGQRPKRLDMGTKAGNDDVPKTRPASSGQSGKNRPDPNEKAWEIRVRAVRKTTPGPLVRCSEQDVDLVTREKADLLARISLWRNGEYPLSRARNRRYSPCRRHANLQVQRDPVTGQRVQQT